MSQILFGAGNMYVTQLVDAYGNVPEVPQPVPLLVMQEASVDISGTNKTLYGQNAFPFATARGETKVSMKVKQARVLLNVWNAIFFGQTVTPGLLTGFTDTIGKPVTATTFTNTVSPPNTGLFVADLGVINGITGNPMKRVLAAPISGEYSVNEATGAYLFAAEDVGMTMYCNYQYMTSTPDTGYTITMMNMPMGAAPAFRARLTVMYQGKNFHFDARSCIASKMTFPFKNTDFAVPELDFDLQDDGTGHIFDLSAAE